MTPTRNAVLEEAAKVCEGVSLIPALHARQNYRGGFEDAIARCAISIRSLKTPEPVPGEWIPWEGGECPLEKETIVEVEFRDCVKSANHSAAYWEWRHVYGQSDIIAYRVVTP